jgi:hypothetical protein
MLGTLGVLSFIVQPALVQGFVTHLGLNEPQAVNLAGLEMLGVAIATVLLAIPRLVTDWRRALAVGLTLAITGNLASAAMAGSPYLWTARLAAGLGHGAIISLSFSFIGLTTRVERNVAIYLVSLLSYGAFGLWIMPPLLDGVGVSGLFVIFAILASFGFLTLRFVPRTAAANAAGGPLARQLNLKFLAVALAGVLAYNIAQGIAWAILFLIGIDAGLGEADVGYALFISQIFAIVGALLSVFFAERFGRWGPIALGIFAGGACIALLLNRPEFNIFLLAVCGFNLLWNFVLPFILGAVGDFDTRGRMMGPAIAMQMIGLGGGPLLAAILISGGSYQTALLLCIGFFVASYILLTIPMLHHRKILKDQASV